MGGEFEATTFLKLPQFRPGFKQNLIKVRAFITLFYDSLEGGSGRTLAELVADIGGNYYSLSVLLSRWRSWRYVSGKIDGRVRRYQLAVKGAQYLLKHSERITPDFLQWDDFDWLHFYNQIHLYTMNYDDKQTLKRALRAWRGR